MVEENNQVIQTIEALVAYKEAKREVKVIDDWFTMVMSLSWLVLMAIVMIITVVFNDWVTTNNEWFRGVAMYSIIVAIFMIMGVGLWKMKQKEKDIPDYEKNPSIDKSLFFMLSKLSNDSFLCTANELLKEKGSDKKIVQKGNKEMLLI